MRLGVELFDVVEGATGGLVPLLQGVLESLFHGWPEHQVTLFGTMANRNLFPSLPSHVQVLDLPRDDFFPLLDVYAAYFQLDVLIRSYPCSAELVFPMARQVVLIPDLQHEFFPEFFSEESLDVRHHSFDKALQEAGAIATISAHARDTLRNHRGTRCRDIFLMSPALPTAGEPHGLQDLTDSERALLPTGPFFIYPANLWPHKNHRRVLEAFAQFLKVTNQPVEFIFTGHPDGWDQLVKDFPGLPVRHLGFVRRNFLQVLLARSRALLFFSLFEGFGMPLLEAFAAGTPVACSNTTSLPEVGGDAVLTCDPTDTAAICELMVRLYRDKTERERLTARGKERLGRYSWNTSASQLVEACTRVHERGPLLPRAPILPLHHLQKHLLAIQADRAARLEVILRIDAGLRESLATGEAYRKSIEQLEAALSAANTSPPLSLRSLPRKVVSTIKRLFRAG